MDKLTLIDTILDADKLDAYLAKFPADEVVGKPCDAYECPLARYLKTLPDVIDAMVYIDSCWVEYDEFGGDGYPMPVWACHFARIVDHRWVVEPITSGIARDILAEARRFTR